VKSLICVAVLV